MDRRSRLESAVGQQIFMNSSKNLLNWLSSVKEMVNTDNSARDVVTAENLLKNHQVLHNFFKYYIPYKPSPKIIYIYNRNWAMILELMKMK